MKTYKRLYEKYISAENVEQSLRDAVKRKKHWRLCAWIADKENAVPWIIEQAKHFENPVHHPVRIYDGVKRKKRIIIVPTDLERVIHHMVINPIKDLISHGRYEHAYGTIPGTYTANGKTCKIGMETCAKSIRKAIREGGKDIKYCLKMDIHNYYGSIDTEVLKVMLSKHIKDSRYLAVLFHILDAQKVGLPLGFYTSQWLGMYYLQGLDHYIKQELHVKHYWRYVDDMVIFGSNKKELHKIRCKVDEYLENVLHLHMNQKWQVFRFDWTDKNGKHHGRDLDFLGYRFYRDKTTIRKSIMLTATRKAKRIYKKGHKFSAHDARQMVSMMSRFSHTDSYGCYLKWIKPYVKIKRCKAKISANDLKRRRLENLCTKTVVQLDQR